MELKVEPLSAFSDAPTRQDRFIHAVECCVTQNNAQMLRETLLSLTRVMLPANTSISFVVVENDIEKRSGVVLDDVAPRLLGGSVIHELEPYPNIAMARNKAVNTALGLGADVILFIDDDEVITENWLERMLCKYRSSRAMLIGGPLMPRFEEPPKSLFDKLVRSGMVAQHAKFIRKIKRKLINQKLDQAPVFTKNWLADARVFNEYDIYFDTTLIDDDGHDTQFFSDVVSAGLKTGWSLDAFVFETIPAEHVSLSHQFRNGMKQASISMHAKRRRRRRLSLLPGLFLSLLGRFVALALSALQLPFSKGRSIVDVMRHSGWIAGRISAFVK